MDIKKLETGLKKMTGYDYEAAEKEARSLGETVPEITFSKKFQCILAAKALDKNVDDILSLNIQEYAEITVSVFNFLIGNMVPQIQVNATKK